jgi:hypothetical protein
MVTKEITYRIDLPNLKGTLTTTTDSAAKRIEKILMEIGDPIDLLKKNDQVAK